MKNKTKDAFDDASIEVPFIIPEITKNDKNAVLNALNSRLLTDGPKLRKFESIFAKFTGAKFAVGVSNGTAALHLSLKALGIGKGSEVIIPDITFVATASSVLLTGATPVLVDVDKDLNISVPSIKKSITSKTKAIIPVHFAGKSCNIKEIASIARKNHIAIIEDCAHAIGSKVNNKHVGTFGQTGCFSFYPTKNFTTIEGGMVITNSKSIDAFVRSARNHGISKTLASRFSGGKPWDYDIENPGYNYRLDEIRASLGINQIKRIKKMNLLRKKAADYYTKKLGNVNGIVVPDKSIGTEHVHHLYVIRVTRKYSITRDRLFQKLLKNGIRTSVHYKPLHMFSIFKKMAKTIDSLSNSKDAYTQILSLPIYPSISKKQQDIVISNIKKYEG
jgi:dTDP-4-amino-4,6-dideoxygalactose transaminase